MQPTNFFDIINPDYEEKKTRKRGRLEPPVVEGGWRSASTDDWETESISSHGTTMSDILNI
jgi:hypothetical protein